MLIFAKIIDDRLLFRQIMEADTLTRIDTTAQLNYSAYPDSTVFMLNEWNYSGNTTPLISTKCWLQDTIQLYHQRNAPAFTRHDGLARTNKVTSESLLLLLLLFEILLVAYLVKNGLNFLNNSLRSALVNEERGDFSGEVTQSGSQISRYLWILSLVVFALIAPHLMSLQDERLNYELNSWMFFRLLIAVFVYFFLKNSLFRVLGSLFFSPAQTERWLTGSRTTLSFYALSLTPILIAEETGFQMHKTFLLAWILGFLIISKFWLLIKAVNIFSIRIGDFLYLILYLCALEILPILLFYKGLFLL